MKRSFSLTRRLTPLLALALVYTLVSPASAFFWNKKDDTPYVSDFSKNGLIGSIIAFEPEDFVIKTDNKATLNSITINTLPDPEAGTLVIGGQPLEVGSVVDSTALGGLRFQSSQNPAVTTTSFTFTPSFSSGQDSRATTVTLYLLTEENQAPIARNMDLSTYKNIAITGYFDAVDGEGCYRGGCIATGLRLTMDALTKGAAMLPNVDLAAPEKILNSTAVGHIRAGVVGGYIGAVEYLVRHAKEELGCGDVKVVATGGLSRLIADGTQCIDVVDQQLVLDGLRVLYERKKG